MPLRSFADASATQPRRRLQSPFEPLVCWLATLLASDRKAVKRDHRLIPEPVLFTSPACSPEPSNTPPTLPSTDITDIALRDDGEDDDNDNTSDMHIPLSQPPKDGLTKEEVDYVVNSLLKYLEEAKVASPELGCEEYEYYGPENTSRRLRHGLWYPPFLESLLFGAYLHH